MCLNGISARMNAPGVVAGGGGAGGAGAGGADGAGAGGAGAQVVGNPLKAGQTNGPINVPHPNGNAMNGYVVGGNNNV